MREMLGASLIILSIVLAVSISIAFLVVSIEEYKCRTTAEIMNTKYHHNWFNGCFVEVKGKMIPLNNYRNFD